MSRFHPQPSTGGVREKRRRKTIQETRALDAARAAVAQGDLAKAAGCYHAAARAREKSGGDGLRLGLQALEFSSAAGTHQRGLTISGSLLKLFRRRAAGERGELRLRRARLLADLGRTSDAAREYAVAQKLLPTASAGHRLAMIGLAQVLLSRAELKQLPPLLKNLLTSSRRAGDRRAEVSGIYLQARLAQWSGKWTKALEYYGEALPIAAQRGLGSIELACESSIAEIHLHLGLTQEAREHAARVNEIAHRLRHPESSAGAALLYASTLVAQAGEMETHSPPGAAAGLRRDALRLLASARRHFKETGNHMRLAECRLEEARLARRFSPGRAAQAARQARKHFTAAALNDHALLAHALFLSCTEDSGAAAWRSLAARAEKGGNAALASRAWQRVAAPYLAPNGTPQAAARARQALDTAHAWSRRRRGEPATLRVGELFGAPSHSSIERQLAQLSLDEEPEPKRETLAFVLSANRLGACSPPTNQLTARLSVLEAAQLEEARRNGESRLSATQRSALHRSRAAAGRSLARLERDSCAAALPSLGRDEALIMFSRLGEEVHTWVARGPEPSLSHFAGFGVAQWCAGAEEIEHEVREALGWPDAVVPETLIHSGRAVLETVAARIWSPLLPTLEGVAQVFVLPDSSLPSLPFGALAQAAPPAGWPRPRTLSLIADAVRPRRRRWRTPTGKVLALAGSEIDSPVARLEARGVARTLGGEWLPVAALRVRDEDWRTALWRHLRKTRLWHVAAPVYSHPAHPLFSSIDLGDEPLPLWWLANKKPSLKLMVLPNCVHHRSGAPALGRIVGLVGPEGAQVTKQARAPVERPDFSAMARALLAMGIERVLLNSLPAESDGPSLVKSVFYAGLARGDTPCEALFFAQRRGWSEKLHPALWAGYECWGWP